MKRDAVNAMCATHAGAEVSDPFGGGHDCWKVGGKIFALIGSKGRGVSVKCADTETAAMLIEVGVGERAPYLHRSWILIPFAGADPDEVRHRIETSYDLIRGKLPKKVRVTLG